MDDFIEFDAFKRCREFGVALGEELNGGKFSRDPFLAAQLRRTLLSVYANFAEGFERDGNREFVQFISIAKGSLGEIRGQLLYALDLNYLSEPSFHDLDALNTQAAKCLGGLLRYLNRTPLQGKKFQARKL